MSCRSPERVNDYPVVPIRPLPYVPPKLREIEEMTLQEKKDFYAMPLKVQLLYRQYDPRLGEPQLNKPDDELCWFSKPPCDLVPNGDLSLYGGILEEDPVERSGEELRQWEEYLASLAPETRNYIESIINQGEEWEEEKKETIYRSPS